MKFNFPLSFFSFSVNASNEIQFEFGWFNFLGCFHLVKISLLKTIRTLPQLIFRPKEAYLLYATTTIAHPNNLSFFCLSRQILDFIIAVAFFILFAIHMQFIKQSFLIRSTIFKKIVHIVGLVVSQMHVFSYKFTFSFKSRFQKQFSVKHKG